MHEIPYLDIMIQDSCNLACRGCITMTDYPRKGHVRSDEGRHWLREWSQVLNPKVVCLFGGEPTMNPTLEDWILAVREYWSNCRIKLITNGYYLDRKPVLDWLSNAAPATLQLSLHFRNDPRRSALLSSLRKQMAGRNFRIRPGRSPEQTLRFLDGDLEIVVAEFGEFRKPYLGMGKDMMPARSDPPLAHAACGSPNNPLLRNNQLFKCGPSGNLKPTLDLLGANIDAWSSYIVHGLSPTDNLEQFISNIGKPEFMCSMCPVNGELIDHYAPGSVMEKKEC